MINDDNFGDWDMGDNDEDRAETMAFYRKVQRTNVTKVCEHCGRTVRIQPHYAICNSCADKVERGLDCY
jgi:hypothetical protein